MDFKLFSPIIYSMELYTQSNAYLENLDFSISELVYENSLTENSSISNWKMEGPGVATFPQNRLRLESTGCIDSGQKSNFVLWCPEEFPDNIRISWEFHPIREPGLAILFFCAKGINGDNILSPNLNKRSGPYDQYHHGDINAYHISYFRRKQKAEREFHTCNLRKSHGFHLVAQGGDPIPTISQANPPYDLSLLKIEGRIQFLINDVLIFDYLDDGKKLGPILQKGSLGFRQMNPLIAEYSNLKVESLKTC